MSVLGRITRPRTESAAGVTAPRKRRRTAGHVVADVGSGTDERLHIAGPIRKQLDKVFPKHWSFMLGEVPLYSLIILILTGTYLTFFFNTSMTEVEYNGRYRPLDGVSMSEAYKSTLRISFDVRAGLFIRQIHHWAALLFIGSILVHLVRIFATGAFRKPREATWMLGVLLFWIALVEGYVGYSLPDDELSGSGLRIGSGIVLSIPVIGTWLHFLIFGSEFPGDVIIGRFYIAHVLLIPGIILALVALHVGLVVLQKHTQFRGRRETEANVVGERLFPTYTAKSIGLFLMIFGVLAALGGLAQINPIWLWGPYEPSVGATGSQPDWYIAFLEGALRLFPAWEARIGSYTIPEPFWPAVVMPLLMFALMLLYPVIEARLTRDRARHNLLHRPREAPVRMAFGAMAATFYCVLWFASGDDIIATVFGINVQALVQIFRVLVFALPAFAYLLTYRICVDLQRDDRAILEAGLVTGVIDRRDGRMVIPVAREREADKALHRE